MGATLEQIKNQLNQFWSGLEKGKKIKISVSALLIIISISAIIFFISKPRYEELFSRALTYKEAATIIETLDEMGVSWEEKNGFNNILVPSNMKSRVKMELAKQGFSDQDFSIKDAFNEIDWTKTQSDKDIIFNEALQSELERAISQIDGIADAEVFIYKPEEKGFVLNNSQEPSASVIVQKGIGSPLTPQKILSIQTIVANGVGMKSENVSVIDDSGNLLSQTNSDFGNFDLAEQYATQHSYQAWIDSSIDSFLETVFGSGNVAVLSSVKINFDSEVANIVEFKPPIEGDDQGLIRSLQQVEESTVNGTNGGVPGTESNTGDVTDYAQLDDSTSKYEKASKTINYEINQINRQIEKAPGNIESITIAVLINEDALVDGELSEEKRQEVVKLIYAATGLDTKNVEVRTEKFNNTNTLGDPTEPTSGGTTLPSIATIAILAVALLGASGIIGYFVFRRKKSKDKHDLEKIIEERTEEMASLQEIRFDEEKSKFKGQINKFVDQKPEAVAQLLRSWLNED